MVMEQLRVRQFQKESESWKRMLEYIQMENSCLKTRLSDVVSEDGRKELLAEAENFQNRFIRKDEVISLVRRDIREFDTLLLNSLEAGNINLAETSKKQKKLRTEMETLEQRFPTVQKGKPYFFVLLRPSSQACTPLHGKIP